jgi:short-subunit dehydrogenase
MILKGNRTDMPHTEQQKTVWITGASSGIGEAVARRLARDGWSVFATARNLEKLESLARESEKWPGIIVPMAGDIQNPDRMQEIVQSIENQYGSLELVILNAGTYKPDPVAEFSAQNFKDHCDLNLVGTANCLDPVLKVFLARGRGHIALVASVAGYRGLPRSLSYGPTKAALINMAEALRIETMDKGIQVQIVNPGFIKTPLTDKNDFAMPFLMDVDLAADQFVRQLAQDKFEITFPKIFAFILKVIGLLPDDLYFKLVKKVTAGQK